ncbi:UNVERIFIED_ORG: MFS transporter [Zoogloea ramigera]|uniref:MFS transporter n=1 Tax=Duganella zoogloeoides TaxID=75659 RepID=A0ABZ0Y263_9BURK|nr:MFS transporter [Duganella zoogloeoides]WQH06133.1 MFS transporter [Duganella zoogloeoides]
MSTGKPRSALMGNLNFRWLLRGGAISMLGDQLTMIALPWLVLSLTGDPLALGLSIALMSIPRAVFILLGGALVDRHSPKRVLMLSKYANAALLALLASALLLDRHVPLALLYALAFGLGLAQAFGIPAGTSILPQAVPAEHLQAANGMLMGLRQLSMLAGPLLAAGVLALGSGGAGAEPAGLALAFGLDAASFLLSAWTLSRVALIAAPAASTAAPEPVLRAVGAGLRMVWDDQPMRLCFIYWGVVALFIGGAMQVAVPVLAGALHGASTLGLLMGANGAGTLLGMGIAAKAGDRITLLTFGSTILAADALVGLLVMPLGAAGTLWQAVLPMLAIGAVSGYMQIGVFTWIQRRVAPAMMGRAMSIFMFIFMGLAPLSAAGTGWLLTLISLSQLFVGGGIILVVFAALAWLLTPMRAITAAPLNDTPQPH